MTASLRNALKRTTHKERAQPLARRRFGLLEKKGDRQLRQRDYHKKESALKVLRQKALLRNEDEFSFAMEHQRTRGGVHVGGPRGAPRPRPTAEVRLLASQDAGYVGMKAQAEANKVERLAAALHHTRAPPQGRRTVAAAVALATRARRAAASSAPSAAAAAPSAGAARRELGQRRARLAALRAVGAELQAKRHNLGRGHRVKLPGAKGGGGGGGDGGRDGDGAAGAAAASFRWRTVRKK